MNSFILLIATKMKQYHVTINLSFEPHGCEVEDELEYEENEKDMRSTLSPEDRAQLEAFQRTDQYYAKHSVIEHIKSNDAFDMVQNIICDGEVLSARWDTKKFAIHMVLNTNQNEEELLEDLQSTSLEDGEYEACGDTGWIVFTRGPNDEVFDGWKSKGFWCYGFTDYRENPIEVKLLGEKSEIPEEGELISMTEKGKEVYAMMAALKQEGIRFSEHDELKFKVMKVLMKDPRLYPIGKA